MLRRCLRAGLHRSLATSYPGHCSLPSWPGLTRPSTRRRHGEYHRQWTGRGAWILGSSPRMTERNEHAAAVRPSESLPPTGHLYLTPPGLHA